MKKTAGGYHDGDGGHGRGHRGARGSGGGGAKKPPRGLGPQGVRNLERLAAGAKEQWTATRGGGHGRSRAEARGTGGGGGKKPPRRSAGSGLGAKEQCDRGRNLA